MFALVFESLKIINHRISINFLGLSNHMSAHIQAISKFNFNFQIINHINFEILPRLNPEILDLLH